MSSITITILDTQYISIWYVLPYRQSTQHLKHKAQQIFNHIFTHQKNTLENTHWKANTTFSPVDNLIQHIQHIQPRWFGTFQGYWARSLHAALDYARRCHRLQSKRSRKSKRWRCSGQASLEVTPQVASTKKTQRSQWLHKYTNLYS